MALNGSFGTNIGSHWRLQVDWSATQNISTNTSSVTMRLYWMATSGYGAISSSASKSGSQTCNGSTGNFSGANLASLSANQKKLINTRTVAVVHDANGTKSFNMSASFNPAVDLVGVGMQGNITISGSGTLNTIPRASSLTSSASWTAPNTLAVSINRASSSFTHELRIHVKDSGGTNRLIKTVTGIGASTTVTFSTAENTDIFNRLAQATSRGTYLELITKSGSTTIGSNTYSGTCTSANRSTTSFTRTFDIGASIAGSISRSSNAYNHTIQLIFGGSTYTILNNSSTVSWSYATSAIATALYNLTPNANSMNGKIRIFTYYNSVQVRAFAESDITARVVSSNPTFATGYTHRDVNTTTATLTGNNQYIVQNNSSLTIDIPVASRAIARNGAVMREYIADIAGKSVKGNWSNTAIVTINVGTIDASSNVTLSVRAVDSRGNSTTVVRTILVLPYSPPTVITSSKRVNNFEASTQIRLSGSASALAISGSNKNALLKAVYRFKLSSASTYGSEVSFGATGFPNYTATMRTISLNQELAYDVQVIVQDRLGTTTLTRTVPIGRPIFMIDSALKSMAFNDIPSRPDEFLVNGKIVFGADQWASTTGGEDGTGGGALQMNNSDITGANGIFFNDVADNNGEGLLFLKTGNPNNSSNRAHYDNFRIYDGVAYLNNQPVFDSNSKMIWDGSVFMQGSQSYNLPNINTAPNGWAFVWSRYTGGSASNAFWNIVHVHKEFVPLDGGGGMVHTLGGGTSGTIAGTKPIFKYLYINPTNISGHDNNNNATAGIETNSMVLRYIFTF